MWAIELPLQGMADQWWEICRATTPEAAAEVVRVLLTHGLTAPCIIRIRRVE